jgi:16S rRNA (adenine1518-N6/adenine1519-N6)-dimethyltransferase
MTDGGDGRPGTNPRGADGGADEAATVPDGSTDRADDSPTIETDGGPDASPDENADASDDEGETGRVKEGVGAGRPPEEAGVTESAARAPPAAGDRDPDALIRRAGVRGDPNRDQHFLIDDRVLDRLPTYLPEAADRTHVLEVGAGTGGLTDRLLATTGVERVTAVERDATLATFLTAEFAADVEAGRLDVLEGDALEVALPSYTACVSNLPYGVSSEITFRLLPRGRPAVLTFQREFAERMVADPGTPEYGRLSVSAQHYADVTICETIPPTAFDPQPAVESAVVRATPRDPDYRVDDEAFFLRFVKAVFTQRRKTVRNGIRNTAHISGLDDPDAVVAAADEQHLSKRAGDLSPAAFAELATVAAAHGITNEDGDDADGNAHDSDAGERPENEKTADRGANG